MRRSGNICIFIWSCIICLFFSLAVFAYEVDLGDADDAIPMSNEILSHNKQKERVATSNRDGCCYNCPNGSRPTCPSSNGHNYYYWCIGGKPGCCRLTSSSIECLDGYFPDCFYSGHSSTPPNEVVCDDRTSRCPDGTSINCPNEIGTDNPHYRDYEFSCLNGNPGCCRETLGGLDCEGGTPKCFYTRNCNVLSNLSIGCCQKCPDANMSTPQCSSELRSLGYSYWCVSGQPDCCRQEGDDLICTIDEDPECFFAPKVDQKTKCTTQSGLSGCCKTCPDGSNATCSQGKQYWCVNNAPQCCDSNGENCTGAPNCFTTSTYKCPATLSWQDQGCCRLCSNLIDRPSCPWLTDLYCYSGEMRCCGLRQNKVSCRTKYPQCPKGGSRQCQ